MGDKLLDQFTFLHFATGIVAYFWNINLISWFFLHLLFEIIENTTFGINIINNYFFFWPGGKPKADNIINIVGDNVGAIIGWLTAYYLDQIGKKKGWYDSHIKL